MKVYYKRLPNISHMIVESNRVLPYYADRMLIENDVRGLLPFSVSKAEDQINYWYDITAQKTLKAFFLQEGINRQTLLVFFKELLECMSSMESYLVEGTNILLGVETVFVHKSKYEWKLSFACMPMEEHEYDKAMLSVLDFLIQNVNHSDMESVKLCYGLYELARKKETSLQDFIEFIEGDNNDIEKDRVKDDVVDEYICDEPVDIDAANPLDLFDTQPKGKYKRKRNALTLIDRVLDSKVIKRFPTKEKKPEDEVIGFFEEEFFENSEEDNPTTNLLKDGKCNRQLSYMGKDNYKDIAIDKVPFKIGSKDGDNDAVIKESFISRYHARITSRDGEYYIEDLESKNGTYLNGKILNINSKMKLSIGDRVSFANIGYRFE